MAKLGRPRTSKTRSDAKREYDRLRMRLKAEYKRAGRDWNDYKEALSFKNIKAELHRQLEIYPKSPIVKELNKNVSKSIRTAMRKRIEFMQNIAKKGADILDDKGNLVRKGIGVKKVMGLFYDLDASDKNVTIGGKNYKYLQSEGNEYALHNGTIKIIKQAGKTLKTEAKSRYDNMMPSFEEADETDIDFVENDELDVMEGLREEADYDSDFFTDEDYDIAYEFDDEFEGAEYKGEY